MRRLSILLFTSVACCLLTMTGHASPLQSLEDITTGSLVRQSGEQQSLMPLVDTQVRVDIHGLQARTEVKQFFENPSVDVIEAYYYFPLPEDSAVDSLSIRIGDRLIRGSIHEKEQAKIIYQTAKSEGKKAAILEQARPNLFRTRIANISPGEVIEVVLSYYQTVHYQSGEFSIRFPSTLTPRYKPLATDQIIETYASSDQSWQQPSASLMKPIPTPARSQERPDHQLSIDIELDAGLPLEAIHSSSHAIASQRQAEGRYSIRLQNYQVADRDFELVWSVKKSSQPRLITFHEQSESEPDVIYTQLLLLPPEARELKLLPRDVTFIFDQSGSMAGVSMSQAKIALIQAIDALTDQDQFNVIAFNHQFRKLYQQTMPAGDVTRDWAREFIRLLEADGGTEMYPALADALAEPAPAGFVRQVVFLTDGAVSNEDALFELIDQRLGEARLFTIGIGPAPNSFFMRKAAEFGRGSFTLISDTKQLAAKMSHLLDKLRYPAMQNIGIDWSESAEYYPRKLPDLYRGQPLALVVRRPANETTISVSGQQAGTGWQAELTLAGNAAQNAVGVARLWARTKIAHLLDEQIRNASPDQYKADILELALARQLMSPYTSFVAVEEVISRQPEQALKTRPVPNLRPVGSQAFGYPATSLNWVVWLVIGLVMLLVSMSILKCHPGRAHV